MKRIYVIAGEMSGDSHGAGLLRDLKSQVCELEIYGRGGPEMAEVSDDRVKNWVEDAAVMGVIEVLKRYGWFKEQFEEMLAEAITLQPDVLLLIDYPGLNLRFSKALRAKLPATKQIYYISPQVWAWNKRRIPKMVNLLDEMLCLFPFEKPIFEDAGLKTTHVGHPIIDELDTNLNTPRNANLIGLFPGSREREIAKLFPMMILTAKALKAWRPELEFTVPAATPKLLTEIQHQLTEADATDLIKVQDGGSHELMQHAAFGVIASGTATLEATVYGLPYCLVYRMAESTYFLGKLLVKIDHIGIANILADREIIKEFIQHEATPENVSQWIQNLLENDEAMNKLLINLKEVSHNLGEPGTHRRAAERVASYLR